MSLWVLKRLKWWTESKCAAWDVVVVVAYLNSMICRTIASLQQELDTLRASFSTLEERQQVADMERESKKTDAEALLATLSKRSKDMEEASASLQSKYDFLQTRFDTLLGQSDKLEAENARLVLRVQELGGAKTSSVVKQLTDDNRALTDQVNLMFRSLLCTCLSINAFI